MACSVRNPGSRAAAPSRLRSSRPAEREQHERQRHFGDDQDLARRGAARRCRRVRRSFSASPGSERDSWNAGSRPHSTPVSIDASSGEGEDADRSTARRVRRGIWTGLTRTSASTPHSATTRCRRRCRAPRGRAFASGTGGRSVRGSRRARCGSRSRAAGAVPRAEQQVRHVGARDEQHRRHRARSSTTSPSR